MKPARYNKQRSRNRRQLCYPIFDVHIPIIPHIGINVANTLVTINYISCFVDQNNVSLQCLILTISFVLTFQYFWIYQNPSVPTMDGKACASPIYVVVKNEKSTWLFCNMNTSVPVVLNPCNEHVYQDCKCEKYMTYIGLQEVRYYKDGSIRKSPILFSYKPNLHHEWVRLKYILKNRPTCFHPMNK